MHADQLDSGIVVEDEEHALSLVKQFNSGRGHADSTQIIGHTPDDYYATSKDGQVYQIDRRTKTVHTV